MSGSASFQSLRDSISDSEGIGRRGRQDVHRQWWKDLERNRRRCQGGNFTRNTSRASPSILKGLGKTREDSD
jgi:hypothetical protein